MAAEQELRKARMAKAIYQRNQKVWVESVGVWATIEKINEEGRVDNQAIQPNTPPGVSACSTAAAPQQSSGGGCGTGCGCH